MLWIQRYGIEPDLDLPPLVTWLPYTYTATLSAKRLGNEKSSRHRDVAIRYTWRNQSSLHRAISCLLWMGLSIIITSSSSLFTAEGAYKLTKQILRSTYAQVIYGLIGGPTKYLTKRDTVFISQRFIKFTEQALSGLILPHFVSHLFLFHFHFCPFPHQTTLITMGNTAGSKYH